MTVLEYFKLTLFPKVLEDSMDEAIRDTILEQASGADDGTTIGDVLKEMPLDSACGDDCKTCIDRAAAFLDSVRIAFGSDKPELLRNIADATSDVCGCYIRG